jgi:hypothetical protein
MFTPGLSFTPDPRAAYRDVNEPVASFLGHCLLSCGCSRFYPPSIKIVAAVMVSG